jgi:hypothetical protein
MITMERALRSGRYSAAVIEKARRLFVAGGIAPDPEYPDVFWVTSGSEKGRKYRVQLYEHFASCSCAHGIHTGADATCAHPLAAMAYAAAYGREITENQAELGSSAAEPGRTIVGTTDEPWDGELPDVPF